mmetsp:Transcript_1202/g.3418  ORF Transcript_1202/g.3418 Transcript_1202/m.3418 type:complete len:222 (+) Transcript_1202:2176-2841(+)
MSSVARSAYAASPGLVNSCAAHVLRGSIRVCRIAIHCDPRARQRARPCANVPVPFALARARAASSFRRPRGEARVPRRRARLLDSRLERRLALVRRHALPLREALAELLRGLRLPLRKGEAALELWGRLGPGSADVYLDHLRGGEVSDDGLRLGVVPARRRLHDAQSLLEVPGRLLVPPSDPQHDAEIRQVHGDFRVCRPQGLAVDCESAGIERLRVRVPP